MKKLILFCFYFLSSITVYTQTFAVSPVGANSPVPLSGGPNQINLGAIPLNQFDIQLSSVIPLGTTYTVQAPLLPGVPNVNITSSANWVTFPTGHGDLYGQNFEILDHNGGIVSTFTLQIPGPGPGPGAVPGAGAGRNGFPPQSAQAYFMALFPTLISSEFGIKLPSANRNSSYTGSEYSHIFLDQFGNNIVGTIPQGISNRQYVVHILYLANSANLSHITYSIDQTEGFYDQRLVMNNANQIGNFNFQNSGLQPLGISYIWQHAEFELRTATNDITFEIYRNVIDKNVPFGNVRHLICTKSIKMIKVFHISFDIGLLSSKLVDPNFELITSPFDPDGSVVKKSNTNDRAIVSGMATFYTSPIVLFQYHILGKKSIPKYKLTGRNFLDDHLIYQRIYPAIGVALSETSFENLIFGLNWEFARGGSLFAGWHYGLVNTYSEPDNFVFGETETSKADFNLAIDEEWKTRFAIGANLDIRVVTNLFQRN